MPPRLDPDAATLDGVRAYFHERAVQGLIEGYAWSGALAPLAAEGETWGAVTWCEDLVGDRFQSVYVLRDHRGRGHLSRHLRAHPSPVLTGPDCELEALLQRWGVPHRVAARFTEWREYRAISLRYGGERARRSGVPLMHHIDEGLAVLRARGAGEPAERAFCLHPLLQGDDVVADALPRLAELTEDLRVLALAMEYRSTANAHLSRHAPCAPEAIVLSPVAAVNEMLVADKVQNAKDFILHHRGTHPRSEALERYFKRWLSRLEVSRDVFAREFTRLQVGDPRPLPHDW